MKKLILLLLFIPLVSFGQTYKDLMSINDLDSFKKVMIENKYQYDSSTKEGSVVYGYEIVRDSIEGNKSMKWASYDIKEKSWSLQYSATTTNILLDYGNYDNITETIMDECVYSKIKNRNDVDYATYNCQESKFDGTIGFVINDGTAYIRHFPSEMQVLR
tara:strand:- start:161 stop:640 length:480 start_codon:yes stop_codon:yes gene_type:complete